MSYEQVAPKKFYHKLYSRSDEPQILAKCPEITRVRQIIFEATLMNFFGPLMLASAFAISGGVASAGTTLGALGTLSGETSAPDEGAEDGTFMIDSFLEEDTGDTFEIQIVPEENLIGDAPLEVEDGSSRRNDGVSGLANWRNGQPIR